MLSLFKKFLQSKGLESNEASEIISFENNSYNYLFVHDKNDPYYFRLILPNILKDKGQTFGDKNIIEIINSMNAKYKVIKFTKNDSQDVWISVEQFVYSYEKIDELFDRSISVLEVVIEEFKKTISA